MAVYVGNTSSGKKQISKIYFGKGGARKQAIYAYTSKSGTIKKVYEDKPKGMSTFTSSGTFTVPARVKSVDIFLVGGGGAGGHAYGGSAYRNWAGGSGGGGGYTKTAKGVSVTPGTSYSIVVGAGGLGSDSSATSTGGTSSGLGYSAAGGIIGYVGGNSKKENIFYDVSVKGVPLHQ